MGAGTGNREVKATNTGAAPGAHYSSCPCPGVLHTPLPTVQVWGLGGAFLSSLHFGGEQQVHFFASRAAHSVLVSLPG